MSPTKPILPLNRLLQTHYTESCTGITADSRRVKPGFIFFALKGAAMNGAEFIEAAVKAGAIAIVCDEDTQVPVLPGLAVIHSKNPRLLFAQVAAIFYGSQPEHIVAVTGTNGKTSAAFFYAQICHLLGYKSAAVGTIGILDGKGELLPIGHAGLTTPDPEQLHQALSQLASMGTGYVAMEASSHGLSQYRLHGVLIQAAAFTNLSRDHMDYHADEEDYFMSKMKLFTEVLPPKGVAVINADSDKAAKVIELCRARGHSIMTFGNTGCEIQILHVDHTIDGQQINLRCFGKDYSVFVPVVGSFQVSNLLCALGLSVASGIAVEQVVKILPNILGVPGRMEKVPGAKNKPTVIVDYAHTPDGLEKALQETKMLTKGKLWVVFGCGGNRDKGKRPLMGEIAAKFADHVVVTDDNPRNEDPASIRQEVMGTCPKAHNIGDREKAIAFAISKAGSQDTILLAGKGHEKFQWIGSNKMVFDDVTIARKLLGKG
jgi:UDP-N-acetylmuramoyl-L-alanyl-D-glutamate--2,6-diaminopimelate ligase